MTGREGVPDRVGELIYIISCKAYQYPAIPIAMYLYLALKSYRHLLQLFLALCLFII